MKHLNVGTKKPSADYDTQLRALLAQHKQPKQTEILRDRSSDVTSNTANKKTSL